jgi:hypothetical protein
MPFGLSNAPSGFQAYMDSLFGDLYDQGVVVYIDDILIYTKNDPNRHRELVEEVLRRLSQASLRAKLSKCFFFQQTVEFLGHVFAKDGVRMEDSKIRSVLDWPTPSNVSDLQSFLGFVNYYRKFIAKYSDIALPLVALLKKDAKWEWSAACDRSFNRFKDCFRANPVLAHPDPLQPYVVETDASGYALAGILSQADSAGDLRPVAFYSRKFTPAEMNYETYDQELLAIKACFAHWRHYLIGANHKVTVFSDHRNLQWFQSTRDLNRRQVRWASFFADFDFEIVHRPGYLCKPDALSRRPDYRPTAEETERNGQLLPPSLFRKSSTIVRARLVSLDRPLDSLHSELIAAHNSDPYVRRFLLSPYTSEFRLASLHHGALYVDGKLYVPEQFRTRVLQTCHDAPTSGHLGVENTLDLVLRRYYWPDMRRTVRNFVRTCDSCQRNKHVRHAPYGELVPLPTPSRPWSEVVIDHVPELRLSLGFTTVLVATCRLTKQVRFTPVPSVGALDTAIAFCMSVVRCNGLLDRIYSDRGSAFCYERL